MFVSYRTERLCFFNPQSILVFDPGITTTHLRFRFLMNSRVRKIRLACFSLPEDRCLAFFFFLLRKQSAASDFTRVPQQYGMCWGISYCSISKSAGTCHVNSANTTGDKENFPIHLRVWTICTLVFSLRQESGRSARPTQTYTFKGEIPPERLACAFL